jgi:hypothetical protein
MNVSDEGLHPDENLRVFLPSIDSRNIGLDGVLSYRFIMLSYVDHRIGRFKAFAKDGMVTLKVFLMMSVGSQAKQGQRES